MDASSVSQILAGKRHPSVKLITKICDRIGAHPGQKKLFLAAEGIEITEDKHQFELLAMDSFAVISEWYHYAILELIGVENFQNDAVWISRTLDISVVDTRFAIERLKRLKLVFEEDGRLVKTNKFVTNFEPGATSAAHKSLQQQNLKMALDAIENVEQDEKDITSMMMAIDETKLPEARKKIAKFRRDLCTFLEDGAQSRVYNLCLQLYPISNNKRSQND